MLGVVQDVDISPDYTLSPKEVFANFVSKALSFGDYSILYACVFSFRAPELPTYVPGFGKDLASKVRAGANTTRSKRRWGHLVRPKVSVDARQQVLVPGVLVDQVQSAIRFESGSSRLGHRPFVSTNATLMTIYRDTLTHLVGTKKETVSWQQDLEFNRINSCYPAYTFGAYKPTSFLWPLVQTLHINLPSCNEFFESSQVLHTDEQICFKDQSLD